MEPTAGGRGAWPEMEKVNAVAKRTLTMSGAAVVLDTYALALPRPDMLTDGSHYNHHYRRQAALLWRCRGPTCSLMARTTITITADKLRCFSSPSYASRWEGESPTMFTPHVYVDFRERRSCRDF